MQNLCKLLDMYITRLAEKGRNVVPVKKSNIWVYICCLLALIFNSIYWTKITWMGTVTALEEYVIVTTIFEMALLMAFNVGIYRYVFMIHTKEKKSRKVIQNKNHQIELLRTRSKITGAYNRAGFTQMSLRRMKERQTGYYLAYFDMDHFKRINETFGYSFGDRLLRIITEKLHEMDSYIEDVATLGGDGFIFFVKESLNYTLLFELLKDQIKRIEVDDTSFALNFSLGITEYDYYEDFHHVLGRAESAMYKAKETGGSAFALFDLEESRQSEAAYNIYQALYRAVDEEEIYLMYQPLYDLSTGSIKGFEALARWQSKQYGQVPPIRFIEIAEDSGFIIQLGIYLMKKAISFAKKIECTGTTVSINISPKQLLHPDFAAYFLMLIDEANLPADRIVMEITETAYMQNLSACAAVVEVLKDKGVQFHLDDFGTGYSSLASLTGLPIDLVKVDKSFVDNYPENNKDKKLLEGIVELAKSIGYETLIEGVETKEQYEALRSETSCNYVQGYYMSRPLLEKDALRQLESLDIKVHECSA